MRKRQRAEDTHRSKQVSKFITQAQLANNYSPHTLTSPLFRVLDSRRCAPCCPSIGPPAVDMLSAILLAYRLSVCIRVNEASRRACGEVWGKCGHVGKCGWGKCGHVVGEVWVGEVWPCGEVWVGEVWPCGEVWVGEVWPCGEVMMSEVGMG